MTTTMLKLLVRKNVRLKWLLHCLINNDPVQRYNNQQDTTIPLTEKEYSYLKEHLLPVWKTVLLIEEKQHERTAN